MPTYPYQCRACGYEFEEFQSMSEDPLTDCPKCDGSVHRIISGGAGLIFKGSGFYITDYRKDSYKKEAAKDKPAGTDAGNKTNSKPSDSSATKKNDS